MGTLFESQVAHMPLLWSRKFVNGKSLSWHDRVYRTMFATVVGRLLFSQMGATKTDSITIYEAKEKNSCIRARGIKIDSSKIGALGTLSTAACSMDMVNNEDVLANTSATSCNGFSSFGPGGNIIDPHKKMDVSQRRAIWTIYDLNTFAHDTISICPAWM